MVARIINGRYVLRDRQPKVGGLADVYRGVDIDEDGRDIIAVKVIRAGEDHQALLPVFFDREVRALKALQHPNIVQLFDAGVNGQTGEYFLILEWCEKTLQEQLGTLPDLGWDDFAEAIALPLLEGLAHAHERGVVHRDVKPSNVLVTREGIPKLADFGISKLKTQLTEDEATVRDFATPLYSPPDDASASAFTRDVYSFGALVVACLTNFSLHGPGDLRLALDRLDAPPAVLDVLESCLSLHPADRDTNALVLFDRLDAIQRRRRRKWDKPPTVFLNLVPGARASVEEALAIDDDAALRNRLEEDLASAYLEHQVDWDTPGRPLRPNDFFLYGETWRLHLKVDPGRPAVAVVAAKRIDENRLERARRTAWETLFRFRVGPVLDYAEAQRAQDLLFAGLADFVERSAEESARREEERLFGQWHAFLSAKDAYEQSLETPLSFVDARLDGRRAILTLNELPGDVVDQERVIRAGGAGGDGGPTIAGVVESVKGTRLILYLDLEVARLPRRGELVRDSRAARSAIEHQRSALNAAKFGTAGCVRDDLRNLLLRPEECKPPEQVQVRTWLHSQLDDDKAMAVQAALGARDFFAIKGPPGTGKTTLIAELIAQKLRHAPGARVLLTSQTHVALDNALERLRTLQGDVRLLRLGRPGDPRISTNVRDLLLDKQLLEWRKQVRRRSEAFVKDWAERAGLNIAVVRQALAMSELAAVLEQDANTTTAIQAAARRLQPIGDEVGTTDGSLMDEDERVEAEEEIADLRAQRAAFRREIERLEQLAGTTLMDELGDQARRMPRAVQAVAARILEDLEQRSPGFAAVARLQAEWLERVGRGTDFEAAVVTNAQVVAGTCIGLAGVRAMRDVEFDLCILDEASKATATEALVPIVRARSWVLVGDQEQLPPFQEDALQDPEVADKYSLDPDELRHTLFDRICEGVPSACIVELTRQHRMVSGIGNLISACFYSGRLATASVGTLPGLRLPAPVTWYDTSRARSRQEEQRHGLAPSFHNRLESREVVIRLEILARAAQLAARRERDPSPWTVLVLTGYRAQVDAIRRELGRRGEKFTGLEVEVNTVDAAQGREADIAIFSVTRSNARGNLGFLAKRKRINVALSRGRFGLLIVGDASFCSAHAGPLADVLAYIASHPNDAVLVEVEA